MLEKQSEENANEYAIELAVEICRDNTNLRSVKNVLSSATFKLPKDVTAKFLTQTAIERDDQQKSINHFQARGNTQRRGNGSGYGPRPRYPQNDNYQRNNNFNNGYHRGGKVEDKTVFKIMVLGAMVVAVIRAIGRITVKTSVKTDKFMLPNKMANRRRHSSEQFLETNASNQYKHKTILTMFTV